MQHILRALLFLAMTLPARSAAIIVLDFGGNTDDVVQELSIGGDGRIYAEVDTTGGQSRCGVFELAADGTLAPTFGDAGRLTLLSCAPDLLALANGSLLSIEGKVRLRDSTGVLTSSSAELYSVPPLSTKRRTPLALDVQPDGRIVVGGTGTECGPCTENWNLVRLNADGTLDTGFGGGFVLRDVGGSQTQRLVAVHSVAGSKILASGTNSGPGAGQTVLVRFDASGNIDPAFGSNGQLQLPLGPGVVALDSSQRIYVPASDGSVARLSADGVLDNTYAGVPTAGLTVSDIAIDSSDRVLLFGRFNNGTAFTGFIARLNVAGAADSSFNGTGHVDVAFATAMTSLPCRGAVQNSSLPVMACTVLAVADPPATRSDLALVRTTASGLIDASFGSAQANSDTYPEPFTFTPVAVAYGTVNVQSNTITVTGTNVRTSIEIAAGSATGAQYSTGCTGAFTSSPGLIAPGQTACVRQNAVAQPNGVAQSLLTIGGRTVPFTVNSTAAPADSVPDQFVFADPADVATSTVFASNTVTISGITGFATVTVTNGTYSIGCNAQTFGASQGTVTNGATICVRHTTAVTPSTATSTTLTVGGVSDTFTTTTAPAAVVTPPVSPPVATPPQAAASGGGALDLLAIAVLLAFALLKMLRPPLRPREDPSAQRVTFPSC